MPQLDLISYSSLVGLVYICFIACFFLVVFSFTHQFNLAFLRFSLVRFMFAANEAVAKAGL